MKLNKKKELAARTFGVGKDRIIFVNGRLNEIKEAITKQDIRDLHQDNAILIKEIRGRKKIKKKNKKRGVGNIRKNLKKRKKEYINLTRKLRKSIKELKKQGKLSSLEFKNFRKKIRNRELKSKTHLKNYIKGIEK
jgi:large subunit ribosomal protein L19e